MTIDPKRLVPIDSSIGLSIQSLYVFILGALLLMLSVLVGSTVTNINDTRDRSVRLEANMLTRDKQMDKMQTQMDTMQIDLNEIKATLKLAPWAQPR